MAAAILTIGQQTFHLAEGIHLVHGHLNSNGAEAEANVLYLNETSVDTKHAIIFVEKEKLSVVDLISKNGTFFADDSDYKRLPPMQKCSITNSQKLKFGNMSDGVLRLCSIVDQHQSSGFHDLLDSTHNSNKDSFNIPETQAHVPANSSVERYSFNIPETQLANVCVNGANQENHASDKNASIPETQVALLCAPDKDTEAPQPDESQFIISTQEFCASDGILDQSSDDLLQDFDWLDNNSQATTVAAKQAPAKIPESASKTALDCGSVEMDALNWSNTENSKNDSTSEDKRHQLRSTTSTPDLFADHENSPSSTKRADDSIASANSIPGPDNIPSNESKNMPSTHEPLLGISNRQNDDNQPLQLSNKENMGDLEPTQLFIPKKAATNLDLMPTQVFFSKKVTDHKSTDLEPTQLFIPNKKNVNADEHKSGELEADLRHKKTTPEKTMNKNLCEESKTPVKKKENATSSCNVEENLSENLLLLQTPKLIRDCFNNIEGRLLNFSPPDEPDSQNKTDFDRLIDSINENAATQKNNKTTAPSKVTPNPYLKYVEKMDKYVENPNIDENDVDDAAGVPSKIKIQKKTERKRKLDVQDLGEEKKKSRNIEEKKNNSKKTLPARSSRRLQSESNKNPEAADNENKNNNSSDSKAHEEKLKNAYTGKVDEDSKTGKVARLRSARSQSESSTSNAVEVCEIDANSKEAASTSTKRSSRYRTQLSQTKIVRVTRSESRTNKSAITSTNLKRISEDANESDRISQTKKSVTTAVPLAPVKKTIKRKVEDQKADQADEQPTTSKAKKSEKRLPLSFTMVLPEKQQALLKGSKNLWRVPKTASESQVLVMDTGSRTVKFLIAMAMGIPIVTTKWVEEFNKAGSPSKSPALLFSDRKFEKEFNFSMLRTLDKASAKKLFENFHFVLTQNILPHPIDMKEIIQSAGGTVHENVPSVSSDLYLVSSKSDSQLWHSFRRKNENICITSEEAVMLAIMRYDKKLLKKYAF